MWSVLLDWKWIGTDLSTSVHLYDAYFLVHLGSNRPIPTVSNLCHVASRHALRVTLMVPVGGQVPARTGPGARGHRVGCPCCKLPSTPVWVLQWK